MVRRSTSRWTRWMPTKIAIATREDPDRREADVLQDALALDVGERREQHARADQRQREEEQRVEHAIAHRLAHGVAGDREDPFERAHRAAPCPTALRKRVFERRAARRHRHDLGAGCERLAQHLGNALVRHRAARCDRRRPRSAPRSRPSSTSTSAGDHARQHDLGVELVVTEHGVRIALVADLALHDDRDAMAQHLHVGEDVRVHEHGLALRVQPHDEIADLLAADRVETAHRLVEEHDLRVVHQRLRDADALEHALRVGAQPRIGRVREPDPVEQRRRRALRARRRGTPHTVA